MPSVDKGRRIAATVQHEDAQNIEQDQHVPSFTADQYAKLLALLNKRDLETSAETSATDQYAKLLALLNKHDLETSTETSGGALMQQLCWQVKFSVFQLQNLA